MKNAMIVFAIALLILGAGCTGSQTTAPAPNESAPANSTVVVTSPGPQNASPPSTTQAPSQGMIVTVGNTTTGTGGSAGVPANSQVDCATMTPTCGACVAKAGCGWCKGSNGCYIGTASGPSGDVTCQPADWTVSADGCAAPVGGNTCESKTNCADCLSGSGCKWCQSGTKCATNSSTDSCASGGWRTVSYQCYGGQ